MEAGLTVYNCCNAGMAARAGYLLRTLSLAAVGLFLAASLHGREETPAEAGPPPGTPGPKAVKVVLDAGSSFDPDGDALTFEWRQASGPPVVLYEASSATPFFYAVKPGTYSFSVRAFDGELVSDPVTITRTVRGANRKPVAVAGKDRNVRLGRTFLLDARGSRDPEGSTLRYEWKDVNGPLPLVGRDGSARPVVRLTPRKQGSYIVRLRVFDGDRWSDPAEIRIDVLPPNRPPVVKVADADEIFLPEALVVNRPPVAVVAEGSTVRSGEWALLDASASYDLDGDALGFYWYQQKGPKVRELRLVRGRSMVKFSPDSPGLYVFRLIVSDGRLESDPAFIEVKVVDENQPPRVVLPAELHGIAGQRLLLDGSATVDPEGESLSGSWKQLSGPRVSEFFVDGTERGLVTAFAPDSAGEYLFELSVADASGHKASSTIKVLVEPANHLPVVEAPRIVVASDGQAVISCRAVDPDGDDVEVTAKILDGRMSLKSTSPASVVLQNVETPGIVRLFFRDGRGGARSVDVSVVVGGTGHAGPIPVAIQGRRTVSPGGRLRLAAVLNDSLVEAGAVHYQWRTESEGLYLPPAEATAHRLVLYLDKPGTYAFTVDVTSGGRAGSARAVVQVLRPDAAQEPAAAPDALTVAAAVAMLVSQDEASSDAAAAFLVDRGRSALPELKSALVSGDEALRREAAALVEYITGEPAQKLIPPAE